MLNFICKPFTMLNGSPCNWNPSVVLGNAIREKNNPGKATLIGLEPAISTGYGTYMSIFSNPITFPPSFLNLHPQASKDYVLSCYDTPTELVRQLKAKIFSCQPDALKILCPYCLIDRPKTLDHYIPSSEFPEYSIFTKNLVPCCNVCNGRKKVVWRNTSDRAIIHFYYDNFFEKSFLKVKFRRVPGLAVRRIEFYLSGHVELDQKEFALIKSHFFILDLLAEYGKKANVILSVKAGIIKMFLDAGSSILKEKLRLMKEYRGLIGKYGVNYWEAVLLLELAKSLHDIDDF